MILEQFFLESILIREKTSPCSHFVVQKTVRNVDRQACLYLCFSHFFPPVTTALFLPYLIVKPCLFFATSLCAFLLSSSCFLLAISSSFSKAIRSFSAPSALFWLQHLCLKLYLITYSLSQLSLSGLCFFGGKELTGLGLRTLGASLSRR